MKNPRVLSIDLGSAYTKVALREAWDATSELVTEISAAPKELSFCVPSVVAVVQRGTNENTLIGIDAANQLPGVGTRIFRNWKAALFKSDARASNEAGDQTDFMVMQRHSWRERLFSRRSGPNTTQANPALYEGESLSNAEAREIAVRFLAGLRGHLKKMPRSDELLRLPARLCIPKFDAGESETLDTKSVLTDAGWAAADGRHSVYEPEANALGILSRGLNATWEPRPVDFMPWKPRDLLIPKMIHSVELLRRFRSMSGTYGFLIVDVGAYTTDFGYVVFDTSFDDDNWNRPTIIQQSYELGVHDLDISVFRRLPDEVQTAIRRASPAQWETYKAALYAGKPVKIPHPSGGTVQLGGGSQQKAIEFELTSFAKKVAERRAEFIRSENIRVDAETLTGGGSNISAIRNVLVSARQRKELPVADDPLFGLGPGIDSGAAALESHNRKTRELVRGGSAVGGASVFFG